MNDMLCKPILKIKCCLDLFNQKILKQFCYARQNKYFLQKDDSLSRKSISSSSWRSAAESLCHMLKFTLSSRIVNSSFVIESSKKTLPLAEAKCSFRYRYVLKN